MYVRVCVLYVCMSTFSNISSETTGPIEAKFYVEPPWDGVMKVCSNGPGHLGLLQKFCLDSEVLASGT